MIGLRELGRSCFSVLGVVISDLAGRVLSVCFVLRVLVCRSRIGARSRSIVFRGRRGQGCLLATPSWRGQAPGADHGLAGARAFISRRCRARSDMLPASGGRVSSAVAHFCGLPSAGIEPHLGCSFCWFSYKHVIKENIGFRAKRVILSCLVRGQSCLRPSEFSKRWTRHAQ